MKDDDVNARLEQLFEIKDPNEIIRQYRAVIAEVNEIAEDKLFPFPDDTAMDVIDAFIGVWLAVRVELPVKSKEQVVNTINDLIVMLKDAQDYVPSDSDEIQRYIRQSLRSGRGRLFK